MTNKKKKKVKESPPYNQIGKTLTNSRTSPPYLATAAVKQEQRKPINWIENTLRRNSSRGVFVFEEAIPRRPEPSQGGLC